MSSPENGTSQKQPKELYMLFFAEMWERFSFYGMRALLVLYLTSSLFRDLGEGAAKSTAYGIYAAYGALVYATPFLGGVIADRWLGFKKSVMLGAVLMAIGHFVMAIETKLFLYIALAFLIVGNGFFKPNISSMVGGLYKDNDARRDGGFTIFYMGINLGAMLAPLVCGYIGETYGWFYGFSIAGIGMVLGLLVFKMGQDGLGENGNPPDADWLKAKSPIVVPNEVFIYILSFLVVGAFGLLVANFTLMSYVLTPFAIFVLGVIFVTALKSEKVDRERLFVVLILLFFTTLFWAFFEQAGSSITLFTNENVNRTAFGINVGASLFQSVNPAFICILALPFSAMWIGLGQRKKEPSTPIKFVLGLAQLGLGFLVLMWSAKFAGIGEVTVRAGEETITKQAIVVPMAFLLIGYLLHTTGELCLSPIGLSMVTKLAPKKIQAMVMGAWFLSSALAHHIGGVIASLTSGGAGGEKLAVGMAAKNAGLIAEGATHSPELLASFDGLANYVSVFGPLGWIALGAAVVLAALVPLLNKWMHGVH